MDAFAQLTRTEHRLIVAASMLAMNLMAHAFWCHFIAYPKGFEKHLKNGKPWVYIPLRWKGFNKALATWGGRILLLAALALGIWVIALALKTQSPWVLSLSAIVLAFALFRWNSIWLELRYRQQEDAYFHLHDSLKEKLESEGKDYTEAAFRNLAAYQHHHLLRKADEGGHLAQTLREQAQLSKAHKRVSKVREVVES
jgi:hypothetical protein